VGIVDSKTEACLHFVARAKGIVGETITGIDVASVRGVVTKRIGNVDAVVLGINGITSSVDGSIEGHLTVSLLAGGGGRTTGGRGVLTLVGGGVATDDIAAGIVAVVTDAGSVDARAPRTGSDGAVGVVAVGGSETLGAVIRDADR
jgi:hypothetical protein